MKLIVTPSVYIGLKVAKSLVWEKKGKPVWVGTYNGDNDGYPGARGVVIGPLLIMWVKKKDFAG
jgi:hypothetical protein